MPMGTSGHLDRLRHNRPVTSDALEGRVALITGAGRGIGEAVARALHANGATVVLADLAAEPAGSVARELGADAESAQVNIAEPSEATAMVDAVLARHGRVDILVNNAGLQHVAPIQELPLERWNQLIATMLTGAFVLTQKVLPGMYERGWGRIVNMGSIHSLVASPNKSAYISAKHGLLGLTRAIAVEGGPHGVTANLIAPAYVRTPLVEGQIADQARTLGIDADRVVDEVMLAPAAIKRLIEPSEVGALAAYLCSDAASMISGAVFSIDGGWTAR